MNWIFKTLPLLYFLLVFITITGCDDAVSAGLSEEFFISPGQKAVINNSGLEITFNKVVEDSRCPLGAECVWEGNGRIEISVRHNGWTDETQELNTTLDPQELIAGDFTIRLLELQPYPETGREISSAAYKIRLIVENE